MFGLPIASDKNEQPPKRRNQPSVGKYTAIYHYMDGIQGSFF